LIGDFAIEDLPVSFTAVATDLESGEEVWLRQGKLFDAIRASIATPLIFTPFKHGGRTLLDGGLVNPVPVAPTLNDTTDITVAVNLSGAVESRSCAAPSAPILEGKRLSVAHPFLRRGPASFPSAGRTCERALQHRVRIHGSDAEHDRTPETRRVRARRNGRDTAQCVRLS